MATNTKSVESTELEVLDVKVSKNLTLDQVVGSNLNVVTSIKGGTEQDLIKVYNAMSDSEAIADHLGEPLTMQDYIAEEIELVNEQTGELESAIRFTIITPSGATYSAVSNEFAKRMSLLFAMFGTPDMWERPKTFVVTQRKSSKNNTRRYFHVELVASDK